MAIKKKARTKAKKSISRKKPVGKAVKKTVRKIRKTPAKKFKGNVKKTPELNLEKVGEVTHYFPHVKAAAVMVLKGGINVGDQIYLKGHTTDFKEKVNSIQLDHISIQAGKKGQEIGLLVKSRVRIGDGVYRI
jgi:putative protease